MKLHKSLTTVTPFSKGIAMFLFVVLPFVGFYLGVKYEQKINPQQLSQLPVNSTAVPQATPVVSNVPTVYQVTPTVAVVTPLVTLTIKTVTPNYLSANYSNNEAALMVKGTGFQTGATVAIEGPYDLQTGQAMAGKTLSDVSAQNLHIISTEIDGSIPLGLPSGYFKVIITNPDGTKAASGYTILHAG